MPESEVPQSITLDMQHAHCQQHLLSRLGPWATDRQNQPDIVRRRSDSRSRQERYGFKHKGGLSWCIAVQPESPRIAEGRELEGVDPAVLTGREANGR
jgi:hypothetical protein